jgi:segregation and condensation protein B
MSLINAKKIFDILLLFCYSFVISSMEEKDKISVLETILFLSGELITCSTLKDVLELPESEIRRLMEALISEYRERNAGLLIIEIANGYQMVTNPLYAEWIMKFKKMRISSKLSMPALETLAIIAYKQPIIRAEIETIRGVNSDSAIKTLLEKRLIKIMGRQEVPGRPFLFGTTRDFLQYFGLKDLTELPTLKDLAREEAA